MNNRLTLLNLSYRKIVIAIAAIVLFLSASLLGVYLPKIKIHQPLNVIVRGISTQQKEHIDLIAISPLGRPLLFDRKCLFNANYSPLLCSQIFLDFKNQKTDSIQSIEVLVGEKLFFISKFEIEKWQASKQTTQFPLSDFIRDDESAFSKMGSIFRLKAIKAVFDICKFLLVVLVLCSILILLLYTLTYRWAGNRNRLFVLNIAIAFATAIVLNSLVNYKNYTLLESGQWASSKLSLKGLGGAYANMYTKVPLSKNCLNISAWLGYQELIYRKQLLLDSVSFQVKCASNPFAFLLNKTDSLTHGIYFNYNTNSEGTVFIADKRGEFIQQEEFLITPMLNSEKWNTISVKQRGDSLRVIINGVSCWTSSMKLPTKVNVGFRGGAGDVFIDQLAGFDANNKAIILESFSPVFKWNTWVFIGLTFGICALYLTRRKPIALSFSLLNSSVLVGIIVYYALYFYFLSARYPTSSSQIDWHGKTIQYDTEFEVCEQIKSRFPLHQRRPYILFVGSSQTWGAGASSPENSYPAITEKNLRMYFHDTTITVINSGICGFKSKELYQYYTTQWSQHQPLLTVIDLSANDVDTAMFRVYIRKFLTYNREMGIKTLLIAEPTLPNKISSLEQKHHILQSEGAQFDVKVLDVQPYLKAHYAAGFLCWDMVHFTDFGYSLFADNISPEIEKILEKDSLVTKFKMTTIGN